MSCFVLAVINHTLLYHLDLYTHFFFSMNPDVCCFRTVEGWIADSSDHDLAHCIGTPFTSEGKPDRTSRSIFIPVTSPRNFCFLQAPKTSAWLLYSTRQPNMAVDDFVMTINSDAEDFEPPSPSKPSKAKTKSSEPEDAQLNPEFSFNLAEDAHVDAFGEAEDADLVKNGSKPVRLHRVPVCGVKLMRGKTL